MRKMTIWILVAIVLIFTIGVVKDIAIKSVVTFVASGVTGAPVHIDWFSVGIFRHSVYISGFKIYNPKGFSSGILVDLPKINVDYKLGDLFKRKIHLVNAEIELKEMLLEKNKDGKLNVDSLKVVKQASEQKEKPKEKAPEQMPLQIDTLKLGMGKIIFKDFSGKESSINVHDVNIHKTYKNINSINQLALLILSEPMKAAGIKGAQIYGVAMVAGVAMLPVAVAATFVGKDYVQQEFLANFDKTYETSLVVLKKMGKVTKEDRPGGIIAAEVNSASVTVIRKNKPEEKTEAMMSARK